MTSYNESTDRDLADAILLFGSLALSWDAKAIEQCRKAVVESESNAWLADVVSSLQDDCEKVTSTLPSLQAGASDARKRLSSLRHAFTSGDLLDVPFALPNILLIPLVVAHQLMQYSSFVQRQSNASLESIDGWKHTRFKEILGLCTGNLAALAVASAHNVVEFRQYGAAAIRLGMLVGLIVDSQDRTRAGGRFRSLSVAWNSPKEREKLDHILKETSEAYVSVFYDETRVTITAPASHISAFLQGLKTVGLSAYELRLYGGFHSSSNASILDQVVAFCDKHEDFQFAAHSALAIPIRTSEDSGMRVVHDSLHSYALRSILLRPAHWFHAFSTAIGELTEDMCIFSIGPERNVPPSLIPKVRAHVVYLDELTHDSSATQSDQRQYGSWAETDIAVVGMACKVAGANDVDEFWDILAEGKSRHREISKSSSGEPRFNFEDTPHRTANDANMRRRWFANLIDAHDQFDHRFFKKTARESAAMDPQQRQLLQVAYQAVEQSGYFNAFEVDRNTNVGCYVGVCLTDYENNVACHAANAFTATGNLQGFIAGKVSHFFGWTGPGLTIDTACSSSLVAVHQAINSILSGECDVALAGGSHIMTSAGWFQNLAAGSFLSPTGQCKPFDAKADGYCRGEGVGAVFLKKMSQALADGDQIVGVIAGSAVQQNQNCTPIFVPNVPSLGDLFRKVTTKARIKPSQISVVEAHGTGTPIGDPAEYESIREVLGGSNRTRDEPLMVSSVKGLVGHMECTSGIISLIKVLVMLNRRMLPPQASFDEMSPSLRASSSDNMFVPARIQPWDTEFRVALINNYGASGSNASLVVTQAPHKTNKRDEALEDQDGLKHPFWLSGFDDNAIRRYAKALKYFLDKTSGKTSLASIAFALAHQSNRTLSRKLTLVARSVEELRQNLTAFEKDGMESSKASVTRPSVVLCFGGQTSTYVGLDRQLYESVAILRKHLDEVDAAVRSLGSSSIYPDIFLRSPIENTVRLQIVLFATQYSFARSWIDSAIQPAALIGHSFGELTALCISQTLSLQDTVKLIINRATLIQDEWGVDKGAMMAVEADLSDVTKLLDLANKRHQSEPVSIACYNGPRSFTLAGPTKSIDAVTIELETSGDRGIKSKRLNVTNAFHSALVDPLLDRLEECGRGLTFRKAVIHLEQARENTSDTTLDARFVADHMRNPVFFNHALRRLVPQHSTSSCVFLEAGTNSGVTSMATRALASMNKSGSYKFQGLNLADCEDSWNRLTNATTSLWDMGVSVQHWAHHGLQRRSQFSQQPLLLPPYQFDQDSRHWLPIKALPKGTPKVSSSNGIKGSTESEKQPDGLLTFFGFQDSPTNRLARFRINSMIEKYTQLLAAHLTARTAPICPATVQMGLVIDAIGEICTGKQATSEPQIQEVEYQSPVCANSSRTTWIDVKCEDALRAKWQFEVYSTTNNADGERSGNRMSHTTGKVVLKDSNDPSIGRDLAQFERLFGHHRAVELLQGSDVDEVLTNRSIYRLFADVVDYGDKFRGICKLVSRGTESAAHVVCKSPLPKENGSGFDAHLADAFCQLGGVWINCMTDRSPGDIYLANGIDRWIRAPPKVEAGGSTASPPKEFDVFATHHRSSDKLSITDVFVFDAMSGSLVEVILGVAYVRIPKLSMEKMLIRLTEPAWLAKPSTGAVSAPQIDDYSQTDGNPKHPPHRSEIRAQLPVSQTEPVAVPNPSHNEVKTTENDLKRDLKKVIAELVGLDTTEIKDNSELADLGIDSLTGMELIHEIETTLKVTLPGDEVFAITSFPKLFECVAAVIAPNLGTVLTEVGDGSEVDMPSGWSSDGANTTTLTTPAPESEADKEETPVITSSELDLPFEYVVEAFEETRALTDSRVAEFGQDRYVAESLPRQNELTVALTIEAFEALGAGFRHARPGERLAPISYNKVHVHLVAYLYQMLERETQIVKLDGDLITRTAVPLPKLSSEELYAGLLAKFPDQHAADKLTYFAGTNLARVLSGATDGVKLIFGSPGGRDLVSAFYAEWPLNRVLYAQMEDFLTRLASKLQSNLVLSKSRPLRILEMGAGTGGTTRRLVPLLARLQVPVEYTFTDLAPSFVAGARKSFGKQYPFMNFRAHDIEKEPDRDLLGTQHIVIASNAVHATHSLSASTANVRKALRHDGFLLMLEMTRMPYWVDVIFGLFEGWWLFNDGRKHALTHESRWKKYLQAVGYGHVNWTDGERPESEIEKLILAASSSTNKYERKQRPPSLGYQPKNGASADCAMREEVVARYVRDLTDGFTNKITEDEVTSDLALPATSASRSQPVANCVLITGGTGGLGAHLVAEAAMRRDVRLVVCLNRRNKIEPKKRQEDALRDKGISLSPESLAKLYVIETDLSLLHLGLSQQDYQYLAKEVTHIVHNAWLMHSKWPVKRFEPQLRMMANLLLLARDISISRPQTHPVTFEFVSSIATVGYHPLWSGSPVVPEERVSIESVLPTGYGDAKYICERMLDATLHQYPTRFRATAVRLGQIAGSSESGHWNPMEHVPFLVKSSQTLHILPDLPGSLGWTPADQVAKALTDIVTQPEGVELHQIYHVENPVRQPWRDVTDLLAGELANSRDGIRIVPFNQWVQRVRDWPVVKDNGAGGANPAYLLVDFLNDHFIRMSCGGVLLGTVNARAHSHTMSQLGPVSEDVVRKFVQTWREMGFLS